MKNFPIPIATYRLQFNKQMTFKQATDLVDYFQRLGISHCYASPILTAKKGSMHGYDIVDHSKLNEEIGNEQEFEDLITALRQKQMGMILDIVPNHMYIAAPENRWWQDVLENGPSSPFAEYFDIDWQMPRAAFRNKVLLPLLDQQYGKALENQTIKVTYQKGAFLIELPYFTLLTDPKSWIGILDPLVQELEKIFSDGSHSTLELKSIITALNYLPPTTEQDKEKINERLREKEVIKKRLALLFKTNPKLLDLLTKQLTVFNGNKGDPSSFDLLESFLNAQSYRLCFWRVANDEINFRRFFDIFEYAGIRTEKKEVFDAIHDLTCQFVKKQWLDGLRIDHIDGLWDPEQYLLDLQAQCHCDYPPYVVAEKILTGNEKLSTKWQLQGTVGYDFLNQLNAIFIQQQNKKAFFDIYQNFTGIRDTFEEQYYQCKKLVLALSLSSELYVLTRRLDRIAASHRSSQDFTSESLRTALSDVIACFPIYRSYIRAQEGLIHEEDRQYILSAISRAKRKNPSISSSIYHFIQGVLLLEYPPGLVEKEKNERNEFVMRFQQLTGPVMAKGLEDTLFYRFFPLSSLNEVGGDPHVFGSSIEVFHKKNLEKVEFWPYSLLATSTHDTKRSEDVRARLNLLSEIPKEWEQALGRWSALNKKYKTKDEEEFFPDNNEEYLLYQSLIGTWPLEPLDKQQHDNYINRIQHYMEKAAKEAKVHTSWINPNQEYEQSLHQFVEKILAPSSEFLQDFTTFAAKISSIGMLNSLSQTLLKLTSPGIPDVYQGNELWDFSLVDPDNRRPVDFSKRIQMLESLDQSPDSLLQKPEDGRIKLFTVAKTLNFRQQNSDLFTKGIYLPLLAKGPMQNNLIAFARILDSKIALVIASRFFMSWRKDFQNALKAKPWEDTFLELPMELTNRQFRNLYTGKTWNQTSTTLPLQDILNPLTIALIES